MVTACGLCLRDDAVLQIEAVERRDVITPDIHAVLASARLVHQAPVLGVSAAEPGVVETGRPAEAAVAEFSLEAGHDAEDITLHDIGAHTGRLPVIIQLDDLVELRAVKGRIAVEAVEVVRVVEEVRHGSADADTGDQVLRVEEGMEYGVAFAVTGDFDIGFPDILGILGAVTIPVDIGEGAVVPAEVGGVADRRERAEVESGLDARRIFLLLFLVAGSVHVRPEGDACRGQEGQHEDDFFHLECKVG